MPQLRHLLNYDREHLPVRNQNKHNPIHARIRRNSIRPSKLRLRHAVVFSLIFLFTFLVFRIFFSNSIDSGPDLDPESKEVEFGHESGSGGNSSDWDSDDRNRDKDYKEEDVLEHTNNHDIRFKKEESDLRIDNKLGRSNGGSLYNEGGRAELDSYKEGNEAQGEDNDDKEYDDGIDVQDDDDDIANHDLVNNHGHDNAEHGKLGRKDVKGEHKIVKSGSGRSSKSKKKPKHRKTSGSTCDMKLLDSTAQLIEPIENKKFTRFSLQYTEVEEIPHGISDWEPRFAGHQTPQEREESFYARDQKIKCGFVKGPQGLPSTGFDLAEDDMKYMSSCHIAVSSCIFGNSDRLKTPFNKVITRQSKKNVCFVMFMDEDTLQTLSSEGQNMDSNGFIGLWKIVVVKNLPYTDMRRVGKIPKFLAHRLFPSARYSVWLDSKLRLQSDPYLILEYLLWRKGYEYAISNHYDRHCVWDEVAQNKKLNKYNHTVIDQQFEFYQSDGLTRFDPSDPYKLLPSYVPEGSFIVRAHTPMSNLFSCLWFNEVDSFTSRDQLSFAYTYLKLTRMNPGKPFHLNMFKDCERRMITKLFRHRADEKLSNSTQITR